MADISKKNKTSLRSKLEDFFNPGPSAKGGQFKSRDLEDPVDIYDHTT